MDEDELTLSLPILHFEILPDNDGILSIIDSSARNFKFDSDGDLVDITECVTLEDDEVVYFDEDPEVETDNVIEFLNDPIPIQIEDIDEDGINIIVESGSIYDIFGKCNIGDNLPF